MFKHLVLHFQLLTTARQQLRRCVRVEDDVCAPTSFDDDVDDHDDHDDDSVDGHDSDYDDVDVVDVHEDG